MKIARKDIIKAEKATETAQDEVVDAAEITKGKQRKKLTSAARDLEKAVHTAAESCESTEEAYLKVK